MSITVIYNGEALPDVYGDVFFSQNYHRIIFRCNFLINESSLSSLMTREETIRNAIREPLKSITAKYDGSNQFILSHTANEALNPFTSITKIQGSEWNTELTRAYVFEYTAQLPADIAGHDFRRYTESSFNITESSTGIQKIIFSLRYTAGSLTSSLENFEAFAVSYASSVIIALDATKVFELIGRNFTTDDEKKITTGDLSFRQIVEDELDGIDNSPLIRKASVNYQMFLSEMKTISHTVGLDGTEWNRLAVNYSCEIEEGAFPDKDEVENFYNLSIKPWLIKRSRQILKPETKENSSSVLCIRSDEFFFDPTNNRLTSSLSIISPFDSTSVVISVREEISFTIDDNRLFNKVWDGNKNTYAIYELGSTEMIGRVVSIKQIGFSPSEPPGLENFLGDNYVRKNKIERKLPTVSYGRQSLVFSGELTELIVFESVFSDSYIRVDLIPNITIPGP